MKTLASGKLALVIIMLLASFLSFHNLEKLSLWEDEGWTLLLSEGTLPKIVRIMAFDQHPPLYFVAVRPWLDLTGDSEFSLRAFSAFFGILSVAAVYHLGKQSFNASVGILAALLLAIWDFSIDLSQDARQYSMLLFFTILSCAYYFRYLRHSTRMNGIGWWLCSVIALYVQYMAGIILIFQLIHMLIFVRPFSRLRDLLIRFVLVGAAFLPWLPVFIRQNQVRWDIPLFYQSGLPNNHATYILVRDAVLSQQFGLILGLMLLGLVSVYYAPRLQFNWHPSPNAVFMALWFVAFIALIWYLNERREILRLRLFILVLPPALILVARGLTNLQILPQGFLLAVLLVVNLTTTDVYQNKPPWREVTQNVTAFHQDDEPVLMDIWVGDFSVRYYIEKQMGADADWLSLRELRDSAGDFFLPELAAYVENEDAFWLIRWNDEPDPYDGLLNDMGFQRTASPYIEHEGNKLYSFRYDRVTDERLATFGGTVDLMKASINGELTPGTDIDVNLWWIARETPPLDYSVSIFVMNEAGEVIFNRDNPPLDGLSPTSSWQPGDIQFDRHRLTLPDLAQGVYTIGVRLYWYVEPNKPLDVISETGLAGAGFAKIAMLEVNQ